MVCGAISALPFVLTLAAAGPVVIGTEAPFPPYTYVDAAGRISGVDHDIGTEICTRLRLRCAWVNTRFNALIPGLIAGKFDLIIGGIAVTPARAAVVSFSIPYDKSDDTVEYLGRAGAPAPDAAVTGVQSGTVQEAFLQGTGRRYLSYPTTQAAIDALVAGKVDLALVPYAADDETLQTAGLSAQYEDSVPDAGTALAVCDGTSGLLQPINATLQAMLDDGTIDAIFARWGN